jgi:hypothetical protein
LCCTGHSNPAGLGLQSFRIPGGLQATVQLPARYKAFPGIINGGIVSTVFDCHGAAHIPAICWIIHFIS